MTVLFFHSPVHASPLLSHSLSERISVIIDRSEDHEDANYFAPIRNPGLFDPFVDGKFYQAGRFSGPDSFTVLSYKICAEVAGNAGINEFGYFANASTFVPLLLGPAVVGSNGARRQPVGEEWEFAIHTPQNEFGNEYFGHTIDIENEHDAASQPLGIAIALAQKVVADGVVHIPIADKNYLPYECAVRRGDFVLFFEDNGSSDHDYNDLVVVVNQTRCFESNQETGLLALLASAASQESQIRSIGKNLRAIVGTRNKKMRTKVSNANTKAMKLLAELKTAAAQLPSRTISCEELPLCPLLDSASAQRTKIERLENDLYQLTRSISQEYKKLGRISAATASNRKAKKLFSIGTSSLTGLQTTTLSCPLD